jgi:predicted DNA-binding transcriptional regulator AlpA
MKDGDDMIGVEEACEILGIKRATLFRLKRKGIIKAANENPLLERPQKLLFSRAYVEHLRDNPPSRDELKGQE